MRAGQTLAGFQLRAVMRLLVVQQLLKDRFFLRKRVRDGRDCLIAQPQRLFSAGKFCVELPGLRRKLPQIPRAVGDEDRADLRHAVVELRQRLKQRRPVVIVL